MESKLKPMVSTRVEACGGSSDETVSPAATMQKERESRGRGERGEAGREKRDRARHHRKQSNKKHSCYVRMFVLGKDMDEPSE